MDSEEGPLILSDLKDEKDFSQLRMGGDSNPDEGNRKYEGPAEW